MSVKNEEIESAVQARLWIRVKGENAAEKFIDELIDLIEKYEDEPGAGLLKWKVEE